MPLFNNLGILLLMSFKIQKYSVWEEKQILDFVFNSSRDHSILCLSTFDSFIERIMFQYIDCLKPYKLVNASEIKSDWMNDHALNMDLFTSFGESHNYIILNSEQLTVDVQEVFLNYSNNFTKKFLLLFRSGNKSGTKFLNKLLKNKCSQALLIEEPKFWEYSKYFVFYLKSMKCSFEKNVERVSFEGKYGASDIAQFAISLAQGISDHGLSYEVIQEELDKEAEDVFALAKMLAAKRYDSLFDSLLKISHDLTSFVQRLLFCKAIFLRLNIQ